MNINRLAEFSMLSIEEGNLKGVSSLEKELSDVIAYVTLPQDIKVGLGLEDKEIMELRADTLGESLTREEVLLNAPQKQAGCFVVPKTVGEE